MALHERIRSEREKMGITQQELAQKLFVTRQTVSRWESGSRCPDLIMAKKLADLFGMSLDDLVSDGDVENYVATKSAVTDQKKMLAAIFILVLSVWLWVFALMGDGTVFAVASIIMAFGACFLFVYSYFQDTDNR